MHREPPFHSATRPTTTAPGECQGLSKDCLVLQIPLKYLHSPEGGRARACDFDYRPIVPPMYNCWHWDGASSQFSFNCFAKNEIEREYVWNVGSFVLVLEETEFQFLIIKLHCIFIGPMFYEL